MMGCPCPSREGLPELRTLAITSFGCWSAIFFDVGETSRGGESYAAMFPEPSVTAVPGAPVLILDLVTGPETGVSTLPSLLRNGEMDFLAW